MGDLAVLNHDLSHPGFPLPAYNEGKWTYSCCGQPVRFKQEWTTECKKVVDKWTDPNSPPVNFGRTYSRMEDAPFFPCQNCFNVLMYDDGSCYNSEPEWKKVGVARNGKFESQYHGNASGLVRPDMKRGYHWYAFDEECTKREYDRIYVTWSLERTHKFVEQANAFMGNRWSDAESLGWNLGSGQTPISKELLMVLGERGVRDEFLEVMQLQSLNLQIAMLQQMQNITTALQGAGHCLSFV